jgi:hypothetical protein
MASAPRHPILTNVISQISQKVLSTPSNSYLLNDAGSVIDLTGPKAWTIAIETYLQSIGHSLKEVEDLTFGSRKLGDVLVMGVVAFNYWNTGINTLNHPEILVVHQFAGSSKDGWKNQPKKAGVQ